MAQTDQERQNGLVITSAVLTALSFVVVTARSVVRIVLMRKGGWDDYLMILAMVSPGASRWCLARGSYADLWVLGSQRWILCRDSGVEGEQNRV